MKKIYIAAALFAATSMAFMSCSEEPDTFVESGIIEGQTGRVVFNVNTGKSGSATDTPAAVAEDAAIKKLSVFIYDNNGNLIVGGVKQDYTESEIVDGKLVVGLPAELMGRTDLKAYLIANNNYTGVDAPQTEADFEAQVTTASTTEVADNGIPMSSSRIVLNTTTGALTAEASMKRAMSSLFVKVSKTSEAVGESINAGDFTYKVKNVRLDKGYLSKDGVCVGEVTSEITWTPKANSNAEELLGYMYQSEGFEVEVTPKANKPELDTESRTVVVAAEKASKRNKKYVLNVKPTISESGKIDFTITVDEWNMEDGSFDVNWNERFTVKKTGLPDNIEYNEVLTIRMEEIIQDYTGGLFTVANLIDLAANTTLLKVEVRGFGEYLKVSNDTDITVSASSLVDIAGKLVLTTDNNGVQAKHEIPVKIEGSKLRFVKAGRWDGCTYSADEVGRILCEGPGTGDYINAFYAYDSSLFEIDPAYEFVAVKLHNSTENFWHQDFPVYSDPGMTRVRSNDAARQYLGGGGRDMIMFVHSSSVPLYYRPVYVVLKRKSDSVRLVYRTAIKVVQN